MSEPSFETCGQCRWWVEWRNQGNPNRVHGDCRRHAPSAFPTLNLHKTEIYGVTTRWPATDQDAARCGDGQLRPAP